MATPPFALNELPLIAVPVVAASKIVTELARANELTGAQRSQALQAIASGWGGKDPQAALNWANGLPSGRDKKPDTEDDIGNW